MPSPGPSPALTERQVPLATGAEVLVREAGEGPPLVLVHGCPAVAEDLEDLQLALAADRRVLAYDRVGYGGSSRRTDDAFTMRQNAEELLALLDALALPAAHLLGWSYGSAVVQTACALAPERIPAAVLMAPVGPSLPETGSFLDWIAYQTPLGAPITRMILRLGPWAMATRVKRAYAPSAVPDGALVRIHGQLARPGVVETFIGEGRWWDPAFLEPSGISTPCLVLHGDRDQLVPLAVGEDLALRLPEGDLWIVRNAGHHPWVEHMEEVLRRITAFLTTRTGRRAAAPPTEPA